MSLESESMPSSSTSPLPWCHQYHRIPPPVSPSPPSCPRIPRFWASSWSEAARVTLSATTWPPPPPQCGTMWDTMWHNLATTTATTSSLELLSDPTVTPSVKLSPSWSHLWTWSGWMGPRQLCQQLLVAMWHTKKIKMKHQKCLSGISCTNSGPQNLKTAQFQTFSTWHPNTFCSYCLILT